MAMAACAIEKTGDESKSWVENRQEPQANNKAESWEGEKEDVKGKGASRE